jgi:hypothetical protein
MKGTRHSRIKKSIALAVSLAALALPATVSAYPVIPTEPTSSDAIAAAGHSWMDTHQKPQRRTRTSTKPIRICQQPSKVVCHKP